MKKVKYAEILEQIKYLEIENLYVGCMLGKVLNVGRKNCYRRKSDVKRYLFADVSYILRGNVAFYRTTDEAKELFEHLFDVGIFHIENMKDLHKPLNTFNMDKLVKKGLLEQEQVSKISDMLRSSDPDMVNLALTNLINLNGKS